MSVWLSILLVSAPIFEEFYAAQNLSAYPLHRKLQSFVTVLYKRPRKVAKGLTSEAWDFNNVNH